MTPHILVADDEAFFREAIGWMLEAHDVQVSEAEHGNAVIDFLQDRKPDVLILDLLMPESDGFRVLDYMRAKKLRIPTIILSNLTEEVDMETCKDLGVKMQYVKSDIDVEDIWPMIEECLPTANTK